MQPSIRHIQQFFFRMLNFWNEIIYNRQPSEREKNTQSAHYSFDLIQKRLRKKTFFYDKKDFYYYSFFSEKRSIDKFYLGCIYDWFQFVTHVIDDNKRTNQWGPNDLVNWWIHIICWHTFFVCFIFNSIELMALWKGCLMCVINGNYLKLWICLKTFYNRSLASFKTCTS